MQLPLDPIVTLRQSHKDVDLTLICYRLYLNVSNDARCSLIRNMWKDIVIIFFYKIIIIVFCFA